MKVFLQENAMYILLCFHKCSDITHFENWTEQVYLERILRKPEVDTFSEELKPHQVIVGISGLVCFKP